jgi:hypothetical protein
MEERRERWYDWFSRVGDEEAVIKTKMRIDNSNEKEGCGSRSAFKRVAGPGSAFRMRIRIQVTKCLSPNSQSYFKTPKLFFFYFLFFFSLIRRTLINSQFDMAKNSITLKKTLFIYKQWTPDPIYTLLQMMDLDPDPH